MFPQSLHEPTKRQTLVAPPEIAGHLKRDAIPQEQKLQNTEKAKARAQPVTTRER